MAFEFSISVDRLRHVLVAAVCALVVGYFLMHGVVGERGLVAMGQLEYELAAQKANLDSVRKERETLEARTKRLQPGSLDLDLLEERSRAVLGFTRPNEYVIILPPQNQQSR